MIKKLIKESKGNTFYIKGKGIPKGCEWCLKGAKVVLFLNGICQKPDHCSWYCPISQERRDKNIAYADEIQMLSKNDLIDEIEKIRAKGMSITGGEPLLDSNLAITLEYINYVKSIKGKKFHVHLYTNGINFNEKIANKLAKAGLDEIRFHPPREKWKNVDLALDRGMSVGAEVPVIPTKEYMQYLEHFIKYLDKIGAEFINLNEFEFCFPNSQALKEKGFYLEEGTIASVQNSKKIALELLTKLAKETSLKIHFCTIRAKDFFQLKNRYLRRAKSIKNPYEVVTEEGLLFYAQIESNVKDISKIKSKLSSEFKIPDKLMHVQNNKINLPYYIALKDEFISFLEENSLSGYVVETIPFRGKYSQITEKTPLKIYKQETNGSI